MKSKKADVDTLNTSIQSLNLDSKALHGLIERSRTSLDKASFLASENASMLKSANDSLLQTGKHINSAVHGLDRKLNEQAQGLAAAVNVIEEGVVRSNAESDARTSALHQDLMQRMGAMQASHSQLAETTLGSIEESNKATISAIEQHGQMVVKAVRRALIPVVLLLVVLIACVAADIVLLLLIATM